MRHCRHLRAVGISCVGNAMISIARIGIGGVAVVVVEHGIIRIRVRDSIISISAIAIVAMHLSILLSTSIRNMTIMTTIAVSIGFCCIIVSTVRNCSIFCIISSSGISVASSRHHRA